MSRSRLGSKREVRPGVWEVSVSAGYREDGRQRRAYERVEGTERDADAALGALAVRMGRDPQVGRGGLTFEEYWRAYYRPSLDARNIAANTVALYESTWRAHVGPRWGREDILSVRRADVKRWLWSIEAPAARNNAMKLMRQMLNATIDDELQETHCMMRPIPMPKPTKAQREAKRSRRPTWGAWELMTAMDYVEEHAPRILPVALSMAGGGLRREEALALTRRKMAWTYSDGACLCHVLVDDAYTDRTGLRSEAKNDYSERVVVIPDPFATRLDLCVPEFGPVCPHSKWGTREKEIMSANKVCATWHDLFACHGGGLSLPYITINQLRHTHETLMQSAGVLDTVNSRYHGHAKLETDYAHYLSPDVEAMEAAARQVAAYLQVSDR